MAQPSILVEFDVDGLLSRGRVDSPWSRIVIEVLRANGWALRDPSQLRLTHPVALSSGTIQVSAPVIATIEIDRYQHLLRGVLTQLEMTIPSSGLPLVPAPAVRPSPVTLFRGAVGPPNTPAEAIPARYDRFIDLE